MPTIRGRNPTARARPLPRSFYAGSPLVVARALLGKKLVRLYRGQRLSGAISEVEAYYGERDSASHAFRGKNARNAVMFGSPGHAYVYFVYGMHHCLNVVTGEAGRASAVLIRAVFPLEGIATMRRLREGRLPLAEGPGRLCQAFAIERRLNGRDLGTAAGLWIEPGIELPPGATARSPRIGIAYARPEHRAARWRFCLRRGAVETVLAGASAVGVAARAGQDRRRPVGRR